VQGICDRLLREGGVYGAQGVFEQSAHLATQLRGGLLTQTWW
jgi:hypothetical protein